MPDIITIGREYGSGGSKIAKEPLQLHCKSPFSIKNSLKSPRKKPAFLKNSFKKQSNAAPRASYITSPSAAGICRYLIRFLSRKLM